MGVIVVGDLACCCDHDGGADDTGEDNKGGGGNMFCGGGVGGDCDVFGGCEFCSEMGVFINC